MGGGKERTFAIVYWIGCYEIGYYMVVRSASLVGVLFMEEGGIKMETYRDARVENGSC